MIFATSTLHPLAFFSYEGGPRILPTYPEHLSIKAQRHLESLGVEIYTNARVTSVDSEGIVVGGQKIPAATVLWGAGVIASPAGRWLRAETDTSGKDHCETRLVGAWTSGSFCYWRHRSRRCSRFEICSASNRETPMPMPGVAQPAIQQGKYVADVIRRRLVEVARNPAFLVLG